MENLQLIHRNRSLNLFHFKSYSNLMTCEWAKNISIILMLGLLTDYFMSAIKSSSILWIDLLYMCMGNLQQMKCGQKCEVYSSSSPTVSEVKWLGLFFDTVWTVKYWMRCDDDWKTWTGQEGGGRHCGLFWGTATAFTWVESRKNISQSSWFQQNFELCSFCIQPRCTTVTLTLICSVSSLCQHFSITGQWATEDI
jgi:hypothetical protein